MTDSQDPKAPPSGQSDDLTDSDRLRAIMNTVSSSSALSALHTQLSSFVADSYLPFPSSDFLSSFRLDMSGAVQAIFNQTDFLSTITEPMRQWQDDQLKYIASFASSFADAYKPIIADISSLNLAFSSLASSDVFRKLQREMEEDEETVDAFKAAGWPIAPSMTSKLRGEIRTLAKEGRERYISAKIIGYYHRNHYARLNEAVASWESHPLLAQRMHILRDALSAHQERRYTLSVPALFPQIEGVLIDFVATNGIDARLRSIKDVYEKVIGNPLDYDMSTWVIATTLLYQLQTSTYLFSDFRTEVTKSLNTRVVTRHTVLHGISIRYDKAMNSLRAFLLLDAISALQPPSDEPA